MVELRVALKGILSILKHEIDFDFWMITRVVDNDWIMVSTSDNNYGVKDDDVVDWSSSVCSRMITTDGPNVVPDIAKNTLYKQAPINEKLDIGAYIGFPLTSDTGEFMGTLCAIDPQTKNTPSAEKSEIMKHFVTVVESLMQQNQEISRLQSLLSDHLPSTSFDEALGLPDKKSFLDIASSQKEKLQIAGTPIAIVMIQVIKSPPSMTQSNAFLDAKEIISALIRKEDVLCLYSSDSFGLLLPNMDSKQLSSAVVKILCALQNAQFKVNVGAHVCGQNESVVKAIEQAKSRTFG